MSSLDRAIQAIDDGLAACPAATSAGYPPVGTESELCWRCVKEPVDPDGVSGLCGACRTVMADDGYTTDAHADAATAARFDGMGLDVFGRPRPLEPGSAYRIPTERAVFEYIIRTGEIPLVVMHGDGTSEFMPNTEPVFTREMLERIRTESDERYAAAVQANRQ